MIDWNLVHSWLRYVHILAGAIGLILFWIPVFATKGGQLHVRTGRAFVWLAYVVSVTAAISCAWALVAPVSFSGITRKLSDADSTQLASNLRFLFAILSILLVWLVAALQLGVYAIRTKGVENPSQRRVLMVQIFALMASIALLAFGLTGYFRGGGNGYWICVALGVFGVMDGWSQIAYLKRPMSEPYAWWYKHMECMLGSGIAFHTAFLVFGFTRLLPFRLEGALAVLPWLLPSLIGIPATRLWTNKYRREFAQSETARSPELVRDHTQQPGENVT